MVETRRSSSSSKRALPSSQASPPPSNKRSKATSKRSKLLAPTNVEGRRSYEQRKRLRQDRVERLHQWEQPPFT
ncbi:hypothetical protein WN943_006027 [Citrus x changshan-huyou]